MTIPKMADWRMRSGCLLYTSYNIVGLLLDCIATTKYILLANSFVLIVAAETVSKRFSLNRFFQD